MIESEGAMAIAWLCLKSVSAMVALVLILAVVAELVPVR
jgi:hypothetical protein